MPAFLVWTLKEAQSLNCKKEMKLDFLLEQSNQYLYWTNLDSFLLIYSYSIPFL